LYAEAGGGSEPRGFTGARYGGSLDGNTQFRVYGKYFGRGDEVLENGDSESDSWRQGRAGFRVDSGLSPQDRFTVQGDYYDGHEHVQTGGDADASGDNLLGRWTHILSDDSDLSLQSYIDQTHLDLPIGPLLLNGLQFAPPGSLHDDLTTYDVDFQHRFNVGARNRIVWGLGFRHTHDAVIDAPGLGFSPGVLDQNLYSAFVQDEFALQKNLSFTVGTKLEHNDYTGFESEPNARLSWILSGTAPAARKGNRPTRMRAGSQASGELILISIISPFKIHGQPNLSVTIPKPLAQNVGANGMVTLPPSLARALNTCSAREAVS
jgi:iron complex outermembrane recepter protein